MDPRKCVLFFLQVYVAIPLPGPHLCSRSPTLMITHLQQLLSANVAQGTSKHTSALKRQNTPAGSQNSATKKQKM
jgi:hypothetical protein